MQTMARRLFSSEAMGKGQSQKQTAIVTGSSRGMYDMTISILYHVSNTLMLIRFLSGEAIARRLAHDGYAVTINDIAANKQA